MSAKPEAPTLANERVGQRSGVSRVVGWARSQNQANVRADSESRKASERRSSEAGRDEPAGGAWRAQPKAATATSSHAAIAATRTRPRPGEAGRRVNRPSAIDNP